MVILWQDCYGKGQLRKSYWSTVGRRFPIGNACSYTVKKDYSYLCMWMTKKLVGKKQNIDPMWEVLNKEVDLGEQTSFLGHVYLACTKRQCEISKDIVDNYRTTFESRSSAGATEKLPCPENTRIFSWSYEIEGHAKKCVRTILWVGKQDDSITLQSVNSMHWWLPFQRRRIEIRGRIVKNMLSDCPKMFILGTYWDDLIFLCRWTNLHDRSQNGPKRATNDYLVLSLTFIIHVITNNIVVWKSRQNNAYWDCFKTPILQEILRIQSLHQVEHCAFSEAIRLFKSVWMCKKQTSVSYSSTESEIMSLNAGWRMDGIPALDLWDLIVSSSSRKHASEWLSTGRPV